MSVLDIERLVEAHPELQSQLLEEIPQRLS